MAGGEPALYFLLALLFLELSVHAVLVAALLRLPDGALPALLAVAPVKPGAVAAVQGAVVVELRG